VSGGLIREASRDGQRVVVLRCYDGPDGLTVVEAEVRNASGEPVRRGPYRFPNAPEAFRFIQESLLALQYLGCTVSSA
jgi:hypothetical protein